MLRVVTLALLLCPSTALAQARTAVLGVEPVDVANEVAAQLAGALRAQVRQSSAYKHMDGKSLEEIKLVFGCVDEKPDCMARAGRGMNAAKLVWGTVRKAPGGYTFIVKLLDVAGARLERTVSEVISAADVASGAAARRTVERMTGAFIPGASGTLKVTCNVPGASVTVGARDLGVVEGSVTVENLVPGRHQVRVTKEGYRPWRQTVSVAAGETTLVDAALEAEKVDVTPPATQTVPPGGDEPASNTGWKVAFWISAAATVGFGGGILGTGLKVLSAQDDKNTAVAAYQNAHKDDTFPARDSQNNEIQKPRFSTDDVCGEVGLAKYGADAEGIENACDDGVKFRNLTNVFIGLTAAAAVVTGVFYYKAYIAKPERRTRKDESVRRSRDEVQWVVAPAIGPDGGGLGLYLRF
jgi:hypothetical protein